MVSQAWWSRFRWRNSCPYLFWDRCPRDLHLPWQAPRIRHRAPCVHTPEYNLRYSWHCVPLVWLVRFQRWLRPFCESPCDSGLYCYQLGYRCWRLDVDALGMNFLSLYPPSNTTTTGLQARGQVERCRFLFRCNLRPGCNYASVWFRWIS